MKQFRSTGQISSHITILSIAFLTACSQPAATSTSGANRAGRSSSQGDSAPYAVVALPSPTAAASVSVDDALRPALPLAGEYAVTANRDDHSLSVVRIGLARLVATVPLDMSPGAVVA